MICSAIQQCHDHELGICKATECVNSRENCLISSDKRSNVTCEENGKRYNLENTKHNHIIVYRMDGGIIRTDSTVPQKVEKCDYVYEASGKHTYAILIELKGSKVNDALRQIQGTLKRFREHFDNFDHVFGRVVAISSVPKIQATPAYVKLNEVLLKMGGDLSVRSKNFSEKDTDLKIQW